MITNNNNERVLREYIRLLVREQVELDHCTLDETPKKKKKGKRRPDNYEDGDEKNLYLDRPFMVGGWPKGRYEGWIAGPPVNVQIKNYLKSMGLL